ncbi:MAG: hypothetical protein ACON5F_00175 [Jejuia sp.]
MAHVDVNRAGDYSSDLFFIKINDEIKNVIFTIYKEDTTLTGNIINATMYFNKIDGEFIDGYKIEDGRFTKRFIVKKNIQEASFLSFFQDDLDQTCWNTDNLPEDGRLDAVDLGTVRSSGGGVSDFTSMSDFISGTDGADEGRGGSAGGGGVTSVAGNIYVNITEKNEDGSDPDEQNKCENEGKVYNERTKLCECPDGKVEDKDGNCIDEQKDDDDCNTSK